MIPPPSLSPFYAHTRTQCNYQRHEIKMISHDKVICIWVVDFLKFLFNFGAVMIEFEQK